MTATPTVWVVDDDQSVRWVLEQALAQAGLDVKTFETAESLLAVIETGAPDVVVTDVRMPGIDGLALMDALQQRHPDLPVIVITAHSDLD
ncbi:MAG: response regulator, partial [Pseudomonadota bacterium]